MELYGSPERPKFWKKKKKSGDPFWCLYLKVQFVKIGTIHPKNKLGQSNSYLLPTVHTIS